MNEEKCLYETSISQKNQSHMYYKVMLIILIILQFQWYRETIQTKWPRKFKYLKGYIMLLYYLNTIFCLNILTISYSLISGMKLHSFPEVKDQQYRCEKC